MKDYLFLIIILAALVPIVVDIASDARFILWVLGCDSIDCKDVVVILSFLAGLSFVAFGLSDILPSLLESLVDYQMQDSYCGFRHASALIVTTSSWLA